jgi:hypothetical protein
LFPNLRRNITEIILDANLTTGGKLNLNAFVSTASCRLSKAGNPEQRRTKEHCQYTCNRLHEHME